MNGTTFAVLPPIRFKDWMSGQVNPDATVPYSTLTILWEPMPLDEWCRILAMAVENQMPIEKLLELARKAYQDGVDHGFIKMRSY